MSSCRLLESGHEAVSTFKACVAVLLLSLAADKGNCQDSYSFEPNSTLDARIETENFVVKDLVNDFLGNHDLNAKPLPRSIKMAKKLPQEKRSSPFKKWVAPRQSTPLLDEAPQEKSSRTDVALRARPLRPATDSSHAF